MIPVLTARDTILGHTQALGLERVGLSAALGRVLGEAISATRQQPPWDNSAMDGYALRAADSRGAGQETPVALTLVGEVQAGAVPTRILGPGEAMRIFTGAPVPEGADAVIRQEDTRALEGRVALLEAVEVGNDIRRAGEDQEVGDLLLPAGAVLRPGEIGVMVGTRRTQALVYRRPRVAILSNGDELTEPDQEGHGGQIVNTNAYALAAQVREAGGIPTVLPIASDDVAVLRAALQEGLKADVLISSGGVSVGDHDHVKATLESLGVETIFWKIRMTPGKPVVFGVRGGTLVFGLPGNPVSSMVTFELFVRPALRKMQGFETLYRGQVDAVVTADTRKRGLPQFLRVRLSPAEGGGFEIAPTGPQGSGILRSMALADGLAFAPGDDRVIPAGTRLVVMGIDESLGTSTTRPF